MKKVLFISGILTFVMLLLLTVGGAYAEDLSNAALRQGNREFNAVDYASALQSYEAGLAVDPENKTLNFNAAQTAYLLGDYGKAIGYYEQSADTTEKFLNAGNSCFKVGDEAADINEKVQLYGQALLLYQDGITAFPQDIPLKYNYELVKAKLEELLKDMESENNEQGESEDGQDSQSQESEEGEQSEQSQESEDGGQSEQSQESEEGGQSEQSQESEDEETTQDNQEQHAAQEEPAEAEETAESEGQSVSYSQEEGENSLSPDQEAIERILQILESQEAQSLKNNQEIIGGKEEKNGW